MAPSGCIDARDERTTHLDGPRVPGTRGAHFGSCVTKSLFFLKKESITALLNSEAFISLASYLSGSALVAFHNSVLTTFTSFEFLSTDAVAESVIIPFAVRCAETVHKDLVQRIRSDTSESVTISSTRWRCTHRRSLRHSPDPNIRVPQ